MRTITDSPQYPLIKNVVENDMCIACGACISACPYGVIEPAFSAESGSFEVKITNFENCASCKKCDRVCPSIEVDFLKLLDAENEVSRLGPIKSIHTGYSPKNQMNMVSSSGGIIRSIIEEFIAKGQPAICLGRTQYGYEAMRVNNTDDLKNIPGSIYHSTSFDKCLRLLKEIESPCLLIAIPCQLEGVMNYIKRLEPSLMKKIDLTVGLICGWMYSHHSLAAFAKYNNIRNDILDAQYRGEDRVGLLKLFTKEGQYSFQRREFKTPLQKLNYMAAFSRATNRLRCRVCEDHINILSDIAVGDAWLKKYQKQKISIAIARTEKGHKVLTDLGRNKVLVLNDGTQDEIFESQSDDLVLGCKAIKMNVFLSKLNVLTPRFIFENKSERNINIGAWQSIKFHYELFIRRLLRKKYYHLYRIFYIFFIVLNVNFKRLWQRIK